MGNFFFKICKKPIFYYRNVYLGLFVAIEFKVYFQGLTVHTETQYQWTNKHKCKYKRTHKTVNMFFHQFNAWEAILYVEKDYLLN